MRPDLLREKNFYQRDQETPFGPKLTGCYIRQVWDYLKQQCDFDKKIADVEAFNAANKWRKHGISIIPVKYGSGYNWVQLEQSQRTAGRRGDNWCQEQGIDYWNADKVGRDWNLSTEVTINGVPASRWAYIAKAANADRQSMLAELNAQVKGGEKD